MKSLAPSLAALAVIGMVPAFGANIADDLTIKPKAVIQARMQLGASGQDDGGNEYNIYNGTNGASEAARFSIRRARFGAEATNTTGWKGVIQFRGAERYDGGNLGATTTGGANSQTRPVEVYYANVNKTFKTDGMEHEIGFGLDKPFNNESSISSSTFMFASDRPIFHAIEVRNVGLGYKLTGMDMFRVGVNVQNGAGTGYTDSTDTSSAAGNQVSGEKNGLFYSGRLEFSPTPELFIKKKMESFAGAEGTGVLIGFDYQNSNRQFNVTPATQEVTTTTYGPDLLVHVDGLSFAADYRWRTTAKDSVQSSTTPIYTVPARMWDVLLGYAIDSGAGFYVEPAIRYAAVDLDTDKAADATGNSDKANTPYDQGEYRAGQSGKEWALGVNFYWNSHANKTQLTYTNFTGETTANVNSGNATAHVFTIQHQLTF